MQALWHSLHTWLDLRFLVHIICLGGSICLAVTRKAFPAAKCSAVYNNVQLLFVLLLNRAYSQLNNKYLAHLYTHIQHSQKHMVYVWGDV